MLTISIAYTLTAALFTYVGVRLIIPIAIKVNFVDNPNYRKVHKKPLPMLAGVVFFVVILIGITFLYWFNYLTLKFTIALSLGVILLSTIGFIDDYYKTKTKDFSALIRLVIQIIAAYLVVQFGYYVSVINLPIIGYIEFPPGIGKVISIIWIIFIINTINFMDGLDGLAGGICGIFSMTFLCTSLIMNQPISAVLSALILGVAIGYLPHNFFPAKIIMGDTGSTLFGFMIATISIIGALKTITLITVSVPLLILAVPIFDTIFVLLKRFMQGKSIFRPDKLHIHHRLLNYGLSQVQAVITIYFFCICTSTTAIIILLTTI
ncbi:MraY family glycosyltransferase [Solibacillus sp. CAU 1738]|uniref:glycosyltransferase family 4 protein n=1 Tax=Solibacillus sp. CAU 1738 TaxID=3140363 RepID=UPI0032608E7B